MKKPYKTVYKEMSLESLLFLACILINVAKHTEVYIPSFN